MLDAMKVLHILSELRGSIGMLTFALMSVSCAVAGVAASTEQGIARDFSATIKASASASEDELAGWKMVVEGTFFAAGDLLLVEGAYALPGGQSKERVGLLVDGAAHRFYLLFPDTLNYQELKFDRRDEVALVEALPELAVRPLSKAKKSMSKLGMKLHSLGKRRVDGESVDAFAVSFMDLVSSDARGKLQAKLYFQRETGFIRVVEVEAGDRVLRVVLGEMRKEERSEEELCLPDDYFKLAPRRISLEKGYQLKAVD